MVKKFLVLTAGVCALAVLLGCTSLGGVRYGNSGNIPFDYCQTVKNEDERIACFSPALSSNQMSAFLFVITDPEDISRAQDKLGNPGDASYMYIEKALAEFSPVIIDSHNRKYNGNGLAIFYLPPDVDKFFYVYMGYEPGITFYHTTKVLCDVMELPPGSKDIFIEFTEQDDELVCNVLTNPADIEEAFEKTTGLWAKYPNGSKKTQIGFVNGEEIKRTLISIVSNYCGLWRNQNEGKSVSVTKAINECAAELRESLNYDTVERVFRNISYVFSIHELNYVNDIEPLGNMSDTYIESLVP